MAAPFCTACGAAVADGTRFCVKCGQPVGQAATPPATQTLVFAPPPPPPPPQAEEATIWTPPPPPPPPPSQTIPPVVPQPPPMTAKSGPGAGLWIGIIGIFLLFGGAGFWFYTTRMHSVLTAQDAPPANPVAAQPTPTPTPTPEASTFVPAPTPNPTTDVIPPNPDQAQKPAATPATPPPLRQPAAPVTPQPAQTRPAVATPPADPPPPQPVRVAKQTSGILHAAVEVAQNGEVVFENLPGARLRFIFDHSLWQPTISRQPNGTQTLVMRSLKAGIQTTCDVRWEIVP